MQVSRCAENYDFGGGIEEKAAGVEMTLLGYIADGLAALCGGWWCG